MEGDKSSIFHKTQPHKHRRAAACPAEQETVFNAELSPASQPHLYISAVNRRFCPNVCLKCDSLQFHTAVMNVNVFFPVRLCSANIFDNIQTFTSLAATPVKGHFAFTPNPPPRV